MSTIADKLVAAMGEIDAVTKEGQNQAQGYKYVRAADVANEVRKVLVKHRIAFTYSVDGVERWQNDRFNKDGTVIGVMNYVQLMVGCSFIDADSGEKVTLQGIGWGSDTGDKAPYKAMTGAIKYALRMSFIIPDESDPENEKAEVVAEVERQRHEHTQTVPINNFAAQATASIAKKEAEKKAAQMRNELAEQQGIFSLDDDVLTCIIKGIQKKQMGEKTKTPGKEFRSVTFNGRLPNGANFASCFDTEFWQPLDMALDKECKLKIEVNGKFANVKDVLWIEGIGGIDKLEPIFQGATFPGGATSDDIPF